MKIFQLGKIFKVSNNSISGAWMKGISDDDFTGKICGCRAFPNAGSHCKMTK